MRDPPGRFRFSHYDVHEDIIWTDLTGVAVSSQKVIDEIFDELIEIGKRLPGRYVVACWKDVRFRDPNIASHYGKRSAESLKYTRAILRYGVNDPLTRSYIRTEAVKHRAEANRSNLYESRADALAAVAVLREAEASGRDPTEALASVHAGSGGPPSSRRVRSVLEAILNAPEGRWSGGAFSAPGEPQGGGAGPPSTRTPPRKPGE